MMSRLSTRSLEIEEGRRELGDVALVGQHDTRGSSSCIGQESSEDDRRDELCVVRQVEGLVYIYVVLL